MITRPFKFTADQLNDIFIRYKADLKNKTFTKKIYDQKNSCVVDIELQRPPTIQGFCMFADMNIQTFYNLMNGDSENIDNQIIEIITHVKVFIQEYQISGAILNELNPNIVARLNGLNDTINVESNSQPVINISLPGFNTNFNKLNENNTIDIDFEVVKPLELADINLNE